QGDLPRSLSKELQGTRPFEVETHILRDDDIIGLGSEVFRALCPVQNKIGGDKELPLLELLQAGINRVGIAMNEENAKRAAAVVRPALWAHSRQIGAVLVFSRLCHQSLKREPRTGQGREG